MKPEVILIRGTSGSGKSTLVRSLFPTYKELEAHYEPGRRKPSYLTMGQSKELKPLCVLGHYDSACGGCDTLTGFDKIFDLARQMAGVGYNVVFEGLVMSAERQRTIQMSQQENFNFTVLELSTPLEVCLDSVQKRREEKDPDAEPLCPKNTTNRIGSIRRATKDLLEAGVNVIYCSREEAMAILQEKLKHPTQEMQE